MRAVINGQSDEPAGPRPRPNNQKPMGVGDVLTRVNLRDFAQMVGGECLLVSSSATSALRSRSRFALLAVPIALLRLGLLALVVVVFVPLIVTVSFVRWATKTWRTLRERRVSP